MNIEIFKSMSLELKGDFVFQKGTFIDTRVYGFLKMALYKTDSFFVEVVYNIDDNEIENIINICKTDATRFYNIDL